MAKYTSIGGQALIEGIMMKSPEKTALAVRMPDKSIDITYLNGKSVREKYKILKLPILRGIAGFIESMLQGYKAMMLSADKSGFTDLDEEEKEKTESEKKKEGALMSVIMVIASVLGVALAVVLFMLLPRLAVQGLRALFKVDFSPVVRSSIEQLLKLTIFVIYVWAVSFMKDIKRVFMYHGAEHKSIHCYECGEELTVDAVELGHAGLGARHTHVGVVGVGQREVGLLQFLNAQGHGVDLLKMILGHVRQVVVGVDTG